MHLQRNLRRNLSDEAYREAAKLLRKIKGADDKEEGERLFALLCEAVEEEREEWAKELSAKAERYLAFLEYPEEVRRHIYTTNPVESVNAGIELMRLELGGYFPSQQVLELSLIHI